MKAIKEYLSNRLKENSSYVGMLIILAVLVKMGVTEDQIDIWMQVIGGLGLTGVALPEGKK